MSSSEETTPEAAATTKKGLRITLEMAMAILLALTALGTAWASWMSELHESNQSSNYARSSALYSAGMALVNSASIELSNATAAWNQLVLLSAEKELYAQSGDTDAVAVIDQKIDYIIETLFEGQKAQDVRQALASTPLPNLFSSDEMDSYYDEAMSYINQGHEALTTGNQDNLNADSFGLVRVMYSVVMFIVAAVGMYKEPRPRKVMLGAGAAIFVLATLYMLSLPLPTDFDLGNFFKSL